MDIEFRKYSSNDYKELLGMINDLYNEDPKGQQMDEFKVKTTTNEFMQNPDFFYIRDLRNPRRNKEC